ncbi:hypothetical protein [Aliamphritea ceti]|uniref:hypothetical protein n=1 Tax=Aliamphritea ceti TaxID=1524258 RepID=UPI0021C2AE5E|nr:hypothetical protein [Aliamphritea ceti]
MAELTNKHDREEDRIRRDSNGAIDYGYYQLRGRRARAEAAWKLIRCMLTDRKSKNQQ